MLTERRADSVIWAPLSLPSCCSSMLCHHCCVIIHNNPPNKQLLVGVVVVCMVSFGVVVGPLDVPPPLSQLITCNPPNEQMLISVGQVPCHLMSACSPCASSMASWLGCNMGCTMGDFVTYCTCTCIHCTHLHTIPVGTGFIHGFLVNTVVEAPQVFTVVIYHIFICI